MEQSFFEAGVEPVQRAVAGLKGIDLVHQVADGGGVAGHLAGQHLGGGDSVAVGDGEGAAPLLTPGIGVGLDLPGGPAPGLQVEVLDAVEMGLAGVPGEGAQFGEPALAAAKVGEGDGAVLGVTLGGDEEQVVQPPDRLVGVAMAAGGHERAQDAAQDDDGQTFALELDVEDGPGLGICQGAYLLDGLDLDGVFGVYAEFGWVVVEGVVVGVLGLNGPVEFVAQVGDELVEIGQGAEFGDVSGGHRVCPFLAYNNEFC